MNFGFPGKIMGVNQLPRVDTDSYKNLTGVVTGLAHGRALNMQSSQNFILKGSSCPLLLKSKFQQRIGLLLKGFLSLLKYKPLVPIRHWPYRLLLSTQASIALTTQASVTALPTQAYWSHRPTSLFLLLG